MDVVRSKDILLGCLVRIIFLSTIKAKHLDDRSVFYAFTIINKESNGMIHVLASMVARSLSFREFVRFPSKSSRRTFPRSWRKKNCVEYYPRWTCPTLVAEPLIQDQSLSIGFDKKLRGFIGLHDQPFHGSAYAGVTRRRWKAWSRRFSYRAARCKTPKPREPGVCFAQNTSSDSIVLRIRMRPRSEMPSWFIMSVIFR